MKRFTLISFLSICLLLPGLSLAVAAPRRAIGSPGGPTGVIFVDSGQSLGNTISSDVALGDLDGDGDLDALVANIGYGDQLWLNQGGAQGGTAGAFLDSGNLLSPLSTQAVALGDLDNDGDLDVFAVADSSAGNANQVFINQGGAQGSVEGIFLHNGQMIGDDLSSAAALGDLDGDGDLDAFVTRRLSRADKIWLNNGAGLFSDSGQNLGNDSGGDVALGDLDGDGDLDAFVVNGAANKVWLNQGGAQGGDEGRFADSGQSLGDELSLSVALADLDGDGDLDAFVGNSDADTVWLNQGGVQGGVEGQFVDSGQSLGTAQSRDVALANLDGDPQGMPDAFVAKMGSSEVWLNSGALFTDSGQRLGDAQSEGVALGDVDGDGDFDAFVANWDEPNRVWLNQSAPPPQDEADLSIEVLGVIYVESSFFGLADFSALVRNLGPVPATEVTVQARVSESFTFSNGSQGQCESFLCQAWLFGDLAPGQNATVEYGSIFGVPFSNGSEVIHSAATADLSVSGAEADPNLANNSDQFTTYFYNCDSLSCAVERLFCEGRSPSLAFPGGVRTLHAAGATSPAPTPWLAATPLHRLLRPLGEVVIDLAVYYLVRDDVLMGTAEGQHYVDLYYTHDPEINALLETNADLEAEGIATLQLWEPNLWALVTGQGDSAIITAAQVQAIDDFLINLSAVASPELQQAIAEARARLGPPEDYVGMSMDEARGSIVGYGVKLPALLTP